MKRRTSFLAALAIAVFCVPVFSQMNLNYLYSRGVSSGKGAPTKIDSLIVDTKVGNGAVTTTLDLYWQCSYYSTIIDTAVIWVKAAKLDSALKAFQPSRTIYSVIGNDTSYRMEKYTYNYGYKCADTGEMVDSIEISNSFTLPSDFVAKNLYLWVDGKRQTGYIQDRALASQQYNQIVGKRRDPAILEFWGNGSYNLRIFPAKSLVSRKVAIEFQHTMDDDTLDLITAPLPFQFDSTYLAYSYVSNRKHPIGFMRATAVAGDHREYSLRIPGLGAGTFSSGAPLIIEKNNIWKLGAGSVESQDPSGTREFLWSAPDKNGKSTVGFSTMLSKSSVTLESEPDTRIIVLDVQNETWNQNDFYSKYYQYAYPWVTYTPSSGYTTVDVMLRAKKSAILCLQTYVAHNQKFNVILTAPGTKNPTAVFESPVLPTEENLAIAYKAIVDAKTSAATSMEALTKGLDQAKRGILIFISDLYQPYDYGRYTDKTYSTYIASETGKQYDSLIAGISRAVTASGVWFFTIGDEYKLTNVANAAGGYGLASLRWNSYYRRSLVYTAEGKQQTAVELPPLFGYSYYNRSITGINVIAPDNVTECVFTIDGNNYYYYDMRFVASGGTAELALDKRQALAKTAKLVAPYRYSGDSAMFRLAGKLGSVPYSGTLDFTITGKMNGLGFRKNVTVDAASFQAITARDDQSEQYGLWAFRKAEQLAGVNWSLNADSIRLVGLDHHIVTRQTSLLALEPGMELWKDTINPQPSNTEGGALAADASEKSGTSAMRVADSLAASMNLDGIPLADLIAKKAAVLETGHSAVKADISLSLSKAGVKVDVPQFLGGRELTVSLLTLQGRLVATKRFSTTQGMGGAFKVNFGANAAGKGMYLIKAKIGTIEKVLSTPLF
jgi:hypothetical protein